MKKWVMVVTVCVLVWANLGEAATREDAVAFYKGKVVRMLTPYKPGGGYDTFARMMQPYFNKYLGATVIVVNEPGATGKVAVNEMQKCNDGLSLIFFDPKGTVTDQAYKAKGVSYDLSKFNWLGTLAGPEMNLIVVGKKTGFKSVDDLIRAKRPITFAAGIPMSGKGVRPSLFGKIVGINVKLVTGYGGSSEELLAVIRGEVDGLAPGLMASLPYIKSGEIIPLVSAEKKRIPQLPDLPTLYEFRKLSEREKSLTDFALDINSFGRALATGPGVPKERVEFLREVVNKIVAEPELIKTVQAKEEDVENLGPKYLEDITNKLLKSLGEGKIEDELKEFLGIK